MTLASRIAASLAQLPPARTVAVAVDRDLEAKMADGVKLLADRWHPTGMAGGIAGLQLSLRGDQLEVVGSDPDLVIETRCQVSGDSDGSVLVPSRLV
jgi:hypothetical protein